MYIYYVLIIYIYSSNVIKHHVVSRQHRYKLPQSNTLQVQNFKGKKLYRTFVRKLSLQKVRMYIDIDEQMIFLLNLSMCLFLCYIMFHPFEAAKVTDGRVHTSLYLSLLLRKSFFLHLSRSVSSMEFSAHLGLPNSPIVFPLSVVIVSYVSNFVSVQRISNVLLKRR